MIYYNGHTRGNHPKENPADNIRKAVEAQLSQASSFELQCIREYITAMDRKAHGERVEARQNQNVKNKKAR